MGPGQPSAQRSSRLRSSSRGRRALRAAALILALAVIVAVATGPLRSFVSAAYARYTPFSAAARPTVAPSATGAPAVPAYAHVVTILMENHGFSSIIGASGSAPYINETLLPRGALATNYSAVAHPSLPNYLALTSGNSFGVGDCWPSACPIGANYLGDTLTQHGKSWKAYMESMPTVCDLSDAYPYVVRHNPWVYYNDLRGNSSQCQAHDVPFTQLATDLRSASSTPAYVWITPNVSHDMHDGTIAAGDAWLALHVPVILNSPAFTQQRSLLAITWDEDDGNATSNRVATIFVGAGVKAGYSSNVSYTHYSLLKTIETAWGLPPLTANDRAASPMTDLLTSASAAASPSARSVGTGGFVGLNTAAANFHYMMAFNYHVTDYSSERGKADYVWGAQAGSQQVGVYNAFYYPFERDAGQNVEPTGHDLAWWKANHPDWLEYKCDRTTLAYEFGDPDAPLDIANPSFRAYVMQNYVGWAFAHGYSGVAFDNVDVQNNFGRCGHYNSAGAWVQQYTGQRTDPAYAADVLNWARDMTSRIHAAKPGSTVAINFRYNEADPADSAALIRIVDIVADEGGWTNYGSGPLTDADWLTYTRTLVTYITDAGKGLLQSCQEPVAYADITQAQVQWCMANYFLVKNAATYMGISGSDGYGYLAYRPEFAAAKVGVPTDTFDLVPGTGVYRRYFTTGIALVNPSSTATYTVHIPPNTYRDLYGALQGGSVTLQPASGIVLVDN